ncbi:MAG TPA: cadmium-translocating P-type ATPase [Firmicutes bacterium]|nr:cadmium-translocating P-type ATPase [Bacillota bacterium]
MSNCRSTTGCSTCDSGIAQVLSSTNPAVESSGLATWRSSLPVSRIVITATAVVLFIAGVAARSVLAGSAYYLTSVLLGAAYLLAGSRVIGQAGRNLVKGKFFDEHILMLLATVGAIAIGELSEAVAVMLFFNAGQLCQDLATGRAKRLIGALVETQPGYANLVDGGQVTGVDPEQVQVGQVILVKPGEKVPLDGLIIRGSSYINEAAITGESRPRQVEPGQSAPAGAINGEGALWLKVEKIYQESSLARILKLVQEAAAKKAPTEQALTSFARYYTPAVITGAGLLAILPPLLVPGAEFSDWLYRALVLLVISCPCALVVSVPLGYFGGIGGAARQGILIKGGSYLDALARAGTVIFDKTGTLTTGSFQVVKIVSYNGFSEREVLRWASCAEAYSSHPLAVSIINALGEPLPLKKLSGYREIKGLGVIASLEGNTIVAGSERLMAREGISFTPSGDKGTVVYVAVNLVYAGYLLIEDQLKPEAALAVRRLKELGARQVLMLTGDRPQAARQVASRIGLDGYYAELLPEDKVSLVEEIMASGSSRWDKLIFVGDGTNDAPAIVRSDAGIAMGGLGTGAAIEASDIVITDDRVLKVPQAVEIARFARRVIVQNIAGALSVKVIFFGLGLLGAVSIWGAVFADVGVAVLAIINSTRTLFFNPTSSAGY